MEYYEVFLIFASLSKTYNLCFNDSLDMKTCYKTFLNTLHYMMHVSNILNLPSSGCFLVVSESSSDE